MMARMESGERLMPRPWRFSPHDAALVRQLSAAAGISPLLAQVLIARGVTRPEEASAFLNAKLLDLHEPDLLPGVSEAADRIVSAIHSGRRITIYGDYDVDGVTATSLLWHCLRLAGATVDYYIPCRFDEGYGLNCDAIRQLHEADPNRLLVSVDCGICSVTEAALARELGMEVIVTDHHHMGAGLPPADCLVHPALPGSTYPFKELCGVGVAFKLAWAVCQRLGDGKRATPRMREFLLSAVGLAAIGTVADCVPLLGENRIIVRYGLLTLLKRGSVGMQTLLRVAGFDGSRPIEAEDIAFAIAPRINAAGRLGQARLAVELLTTDNQSRADQLAEYLDQLNSNRKTVERRIFKEAKELVASRPEWERAGALVLADYEWHPGVIGIVASRVAQHFERPAVLLSINRQTRIAQGSGRSFASFDLYSGLSACAPYLLAFGGHRAAAGVKVHEDGLDGFREALCGFVAQNHCLSDDDRAVRVDAEVRLADVTRAAVRELDRLGPFGQENPRPSFVSSRVELVEPPRTMGDGERHLCLRVRQFGTVMRVIAFGRAEWAEPIEKAAGPISICFTAGINSYNGFESVELQLEDWQADETPASPEERNVRVGQACNLS